MMSEVRWIERVLVRCTVCITGLGVAIAVPVAADPGAFEPQPFALGADGAAAADVLIARGLSQADTWDVFVVNANIHTAQSGEIAVPDRLYSCCAQGPGYVDSGLAFDEVPEAGVAAALADFNGDSRADIVVAGGRTDLLPARSRLYLRRGAGGFASFTIGDAEASTAVATADWDGDGDIDIAIARVAAEVDLFRNDTPPGAQVPTFVNVGVLSMSIGPVTDIAFGRFGPGASVGLAVLRNQPLPGQPTSSPAVLHYVNTGTSPYFDNTAVTTTPLIGGTPTDLAVGRFDNDSFDDLVVAGRSALDAAEGASRVLHGGAALFAVDDFRFPPAHQDTVAVADFNSDGRQDIVFGQVRCPDPGNCGADTGSTLSMWLRTEFDFESNAQCLGRGIDTPVALGAGLMYSDGYPDVFVLAAGGGGTGWWRNDAPVAANQCCVVETAANDPPASGAMASLHGVSGPVDVQAFARLRDGIMADAIDGPRLISRYATFSPDIVGRMLADPTLLGDAATAIAQWSPAVRALVDGDGDQATVSADMLDAIDDFLTRLSGAGNPALTQVIAEERARLPPFAALVGLDMDEFRNAVLPTDITFRDSFE